jgi:hypothetical protein
MAANLLCQFLSSLRLVIGLNICATAAMINGAVNQFREVCAIRSDRLNARTYLTYISGKLR